MKQRPAWSARLAGARWAICGVAGLVAVLAGCGPEPLPPELQSTPVCSELHPSAETGLPRGLILVVNDTMRRDALAVHGGRARTPALDRFATDHLIFEHAVSQAPWTKPSIATLFTSLHPSQHRVESHPQLGGRSDELGDAPARADVLADSLVTLAETLQSAGVRTAAFVANPWLVAPFGFDQGFDVYDASFARWGADGDAVVRAGLEWLDGLEPGDRFFLYLHTIDSHRPYGAISTAHLDRTRARLNSGRPVPTEEGQAYARRIRLDDGRFAVDAGFLPTIELIRASYTSGVERFDGTFSRLLEALEARPGLWSDTAMIVTSDHGEALYERGWGNHGGALFEEDVLVPMLARLPGVLPTAGRIDCPVGLIDLMPSVCDYMGAVCPELVQGVSVFEMEDRSGRVASRYLVSEGVMNRELDRTIRTDRFKLVRSAPEGADPEDASWTYGLFDLQSDPGEQFNRLDPRIRTPETQRILERLKPALDAAVDEMPAPEHGTAVIDADVQRQLEALGYGEPPTER